MEKSERMLIDENKPIAEKLKAIGAAFIIGLLVNYFFTEDDIGVSAVIYHGVVILGAIWILHRKIDLNKSISYIFLVPIVLLSSTYAIYNNEVLRTINSMLIPLLIVSYILIIRYEEIKEIKLDLLARIVERILPESFATIPKLFDFTKEIIRSRKKSKMNGTQKNILRGLLLSLPLLLVIIGLLASADRVFQYYVEDLGNLFGKLDLFNFLGDCIIVIPITLYMFGFLWSFQYENKVDREAINIKRIEWEPITLITIIFTINIVYLLFTVIQFSYLYAEGAQLPMGFSHAVYARKGFFELVFVTIINFIILSTSMKFCKRDNLKVNKIANVSYSLLIGFTFNMLFSANYKMNMYEKMFGYTRLRLFVQVFMLLLAILLIIVLVGIWMKKVPVLKLIIIATMVVYIGLNFMNVDKIIAKNNIERYKMDQKIDMDYLESLSFDAFDEVAKLVDSKETKIQIKTIQYMKRKIKSIKDSYDHWYEYNYYKGNILKRYQ
ncbi:DUF4153 domain-containing protein [Marinisporobacter balticus]|uniref:Uncharacterized protein DUF4173 n=1 Tax=Marinisporobacter balticus TaxID=2018667 RepID=A0A4R2L2W8_9FIRM|nr:DUF4173 domain-containing protein [Marinisporobacter balticus]TCO76908.1 uncharacterized protein DUF4173 [Marinisporobacter balticus]